MLSGCADQYEYFSTNIVGPFDTVTTYISYAVNEEEFNKQKLLNLMWFTVSDFFFVVIALCSVLEIYLYHLLIVYIMKTS